jgi:hypothetical protein
MKACQQHSSPDKASISVLLAGWIAVLPFLTTLHLAMVPHVFCPEHGHLHEIVREDGRPAPRVRTGSQSPATSLIPRTHRWTTQAAECPFADLALRQGAAVPRPVPAVRPMASGSLLPVFFPDGVVALEALSLAPKHSPPALAS